jgi:hypothetical protein
VTDRFRRATALIGRQHLAFAATRGPFGGGSCDGDAVQIDWTLHTAEDVGHADLRRRGACDADGSDEQLHRTLLLGKDMLDARAHLRLDVVGASAASGIGLLLGLWRGFG